MTGDYFVHDAAICESQKVGSRSRIWAFVHILPGARIGADCNICDHVFIENDVIIGDRVTVKSGVQLWDGVRLEDDVFVGPNVTFTNDKYPRSRHWLEEHPVTTVQRGASIGANATILPGIRIGQDAMVGAGAVVTEHVPPNAVVYGNPARIRGYRGVPEQGVAARVYAASLDVEVPLPGGARVIALGSAEDMRGSLVALEFSADLPFRPERLFAVFDVPSAEVRGEHAHRMCHQLLVCTRGSVVLLVDDGSDRCELVLNNPRMALYLPPMLWGSQRGFSPDAVLTVLASHPYDPTDYIRDYGEFVRLKAGEGDVSGTLS